MRNKKIVMRLDLYEQFSFPDVSERKAPTDDIFKQSVTVTSDKGWLWTRTSLEHECRLRWMEWAQWHKKRPDKIKHLKWMEKHGCESDEMIISPVKSKFQREADRNCNNQTQNKGMESIYSNPL